jgi:hypothetical protein
LFLYFPSRQRSTNLIPTTSATPKQKTCNLIFSATNPSVAAPRDLRQAHLPWQLPDHTIILHPTYTPNRRKRHQCFNATKTQRISILQLFLFPRCQQQKLPSANRKEIKPKLLFVHTKKLEDKKFITLLSFQISTISLMHM